MAVGRAAHVISFAVGGLTVAAVQLLLRRRSRAAAVAIPVTVKRQATVRAYRQKSELERSSVPQVIPDTPRERAHALAARYHAKAELVNHGIKVLLATAGAEAVKGALPLMRRNPNRPLLPKYKRIDAVVDDLAAMQHLLHGQKSKQLETALASTHQLLKLNLGKLGGLDAAHPLKRKLDGALHECEGANDGTACAARGAAPMIADLTEANDALYGLIGDLSVAVQQVCDADADYDPFVDQELRSRAVRDTAALEEVLV